MARNIQDYDNKQEITSAWGGKSRIFYDWPIIFSGKIWRAFPDL